MNLYTSNQIATSNEPVDDVLITKIQKHKRTINLIKVMRFCLIILFVTSLFLDVNRFNFKTIPIEYKPFAANSITNDYCYINSNSIQSEAFEIQTYITTNGVYSNTLSTRKYYYALDENGFAFLVCTDSNIDVFFENTPNSDNQDAKLYGFVTTLPENLEINPYNIHQNSNQSNETFISSIKQYKVFSIKSNTPQEQQIKDGTNPIYILLMITRVLVFIAIIVLYIIKERYIIKYKKDIKTEIERLQSLENPSASSSDEQNN